jgi:Flp pilus assembly pilin Flp
MQQIFRSVMQCQIWKDQRGQDLIEYSLMGALFVLTAGAIMPGVANSLTSIFSQVNSVMISAASN